MAEIEWLDIPVAKATKKQRYSLHRLGWAKSVVAKLTVEQADYHIKAALAARHANDLKSVNEGAGKNTNE